MVASAPPTTESAPRPDPSPAPPRAEPDSLAPRLWQLLQLCNEWLKFAETKNAGIVGLAGTGITFIVVALGFLRDEGVSTAAGMALTGGSILMAFSLLAGVWSFMPATSMPRWMRSRFGEPRPDDNLIYFGHVAKYAPGPLAEAIARRYERHPDPVISDLDHDLAAQLVVNARITLQKLAFFRWAVLLFAAGALLAAAAMLTVLL